MTLKSLLGSRLQKTEAGPLGANGPSVLQPAAWATGSGIEPAPTLHRCREGQRASDLARM